MPPSTAQTLAGVLPLHALSGVDPVLAAVLVAAGLGTAALALLGIVAAIGRRSVSYLLIAAALSTLALRTGVAVSTMAGVVPFESHHTLEHALDAVMAGLVLLAVYYARRVERSVRTRSAGSGTTDGEASAERSHTAGRVETDGGTSGAATEPERPLPEEDR
jgi:hypothetical protein